MLFLWASGLSISTIGVTTCLWASGLSISTIGISYCTKSNDN